MFSFAGNKAQNRWQHLDGLPCEESASLMQGSDGFIWIGTRLGLYRYDGYAIKDFRNDVSHPFAFSSCNILCLSNDHNGHIIAGTFFGLNTLQLQTQSVAIRHLEGSDYISAVLHDSNDRLWIGTDNGLYLKQNDERIILFKQIPHDMVLRIVESSPQTVIVVTRSNGLFLIDLQNRCTAIKGTAQLNPCTACGGTGDTIWVGTNQGGLYSIKKGVITHHDGFDGYKINALLRHPADNQLVIGTDRGVTYYPSYLALPELPGLNITDLCSDNTGNVWASTSSDGVYRLLSHCAQFRVFDSSFPQQTNPLMSQFDVRHLTDTVLWKAIPHINAICERADGTTFVGTDNNGIYIIKQGEICHHLNKNNTPWLNTNSVYAFCPLGAESVLLATWYGLYIMDNDYNGHFVENIGKSNIATMHTLSVNRVGTNDYWLGLVGGIAHVQGDFRKPASAHITIYTHINTPSSSDVRNVGMLTDRHEETGMYQLGGIYRILKDPQGRIWACTSEPGLLLYDPENDTFRSVSQKMGITGDNVHSIDMDQYGNYWMTTNFGILQMRIDSKGKILQRQLYTQYSGLPSSYYGSTMSTVLADGTICFLNQQRLIMLSSNRQFRKATSWKTFISEICINGTPISATGTDIDLLPPFTQRITLPYDQNNIMLYFTSLSYGDESSISYSYKLEGVDHDYQQTAMGSNVVNYHQLPPGTYTLSYGLANGNNETSGDYRLLTIKILQPLWWRWWAKLLYAGLFLAIAGLMVRAFVNQKRKQHQLEIMKIEKRQREEFYQKKMQFYTKAFHEFMTPLKLIGDISHSLHEKVRPSLQATLYMLVTQVDKLQDAIGNIVDAEDGKLAHEALLKAKEMTQVDQDFLRRCVESVNTHIADVDYSHQVMMAEVGASHATLYRKLKALTGMDATSFIRSIRMRSACQIMTQTPGIRISELAERVGYNNPQYFSTCFKKEFGISPREYIEQNMNTI